MKRRIRVLIIDSDKDYCLIMRIALESKGACEVYYENKVNMGISAAEGINPDIILLDIVMPDKSGFGMLDALKRNHRTSHIPVIIVTALSSDDARVEASRHYSEAYLEKASDTNELEKKIIDIIRIRGIIPDGDRENKAGADTEVERPESAPAERPHGEEADTKTAVPSYGASEVWNGRKVLFISDEAASLVYLDNFFSSSGFDFCFCSDLTKVCETFEIERPDIVIVDIALKKIEGSDIIGRIKKSRIKSKIIVITSIGEAPVVRDLIKHGADDILIKPYSVNQLYATIIKNLIS